MSVTQTARLATALHGDESVDAEAHKEDQVDQVDRPWGELREELAQGMIVQREKLVIDDHGYVVAENLLIGVEPGGHQRVEDRCVA